MMVLRSRLRDRVKLGGNRAGVGETLERRDLLAADLVGLEATASHETSLAEFVTDVNWSKSHANGAFFRAGTDLLFTPAIVGGSATGTPPDSPSNAVDPNVPAGGQFGGVAHVQIMVPDFPAPTQADPNNTITAEFSCTGSVIAPNYVLTAAHCFDPIDSDGQIEPGLTAEVQLNDGDPAGNGLFSSTHTVSTITIHDSFEGFSVNLNDDLAVLKLATPVPTGTPMYAVTDSIMSPSQRLNMVGYGLTGSGDTGLISNTSDPDFRSPEVKRQRQNVADVFVGDDERTPVEIPPGSGNFFPLPAGPDELFVFDFDGPASNGFMGGATLGNDVEGNIAPGDSGGPSFLMDATGNLITDGEGRLILGGINTFNGAFGFGQDPGTFVTSSAPTGGLAGGVMLGAYTDWINSAISVDVGLSSDVTIESVGANTVVTYELTATNHQLGEATGLTIAQDMLMAPVGASVSVDATNGAGSFSGGVWDIGTLAGAASETLTIQIEFNPRTTAGFPFNIEFSVQDLAEDDADPANDSVSDVVDLGKPLDVSVYGSSWVVDKYSLAQGENGTLPWTNLDRLSFTFPALNPIPTLQIFGPTNGAPEIPATIVGYDGLTMDFSIPTLETGYYKIVMNGMEIDFSVLPGDIDDTGSVNAFDLSQFIGKLQSGGPISTTPQRADVNGSGVVDIFDLSLFLGYFGQDLSGVTPPVIAPPPPPAPVAANAAVLDTIWAEEAVEEEVEEVVTSSSTAASMIVGRRGRRRV